MELTKRWRWLGIEFLVISLGVFSALVVDTWVEDRKDDRREAEYRDRLAMDLRRDLANLNAVVAYHQRVREYGLTTLAVDRRTRRQGDSKPSWNSSGAVQ